MFFLGESQDGIFKTANGTLDAPGCPMIIDWRLYDFIALLILEGFNLVCNKTRSLIYVNFPWHPMICYITF